MTSAIRRSESALPGKSQETPTPSPTILTKKGKQEGPPLPVINNFK